MNDTLVDLKKSVYIHQITASSMITEQREVTMNKRFNMVGLILAYSIWLITH